jgi:hypothetical protein
MLTTININVSLEANISNNNNLVSGDVSNYYLNYDDEGNIINNTGAGTTIKPVISNNNADSGDISPEIDAISTLISIVYPLFNIINSTFTGNFSVSPVRNPLEFTPPVYNRNYSSIPYYIIIIILISRNSSPSRKITIIIIIIITREREIK